MQRVHLRKNARMFGSSRYIASESVKDLHLEMEGLKISVANQAEDDGLHTETDSREIFVPYTNITAFDSFEADSYIGDVLGRDVKISFIESVRMLGSEKTQVVEKVSSRPPGVQIELQDESVIVPQSNIAALALDTDTL